MLTDDEIRTAWLMILGREPDNERIYAAYRHSELKTLRAALFASDAQLQALRVEQDRIGEQIAGIKAQKAALPEDEYYNRLEPVLIEMARVGARIDARFVALGVNVEGTGDARP